MCCFSNLTATERCPDMNGISVFFLLKVAVVEGFINSVDSQMRQRQEQQKLATISARIDSYEAVEGSSEEVEKVIFQRFPASSKSSVRSETSREIRPHPFLSFFLLPPSDPQGVQPLRPDGSHERNVTGGDSTAASGGSAEDERGQRQSGKTGSRDCL